jgi:hypothetical protein
VRWQCSGATETDTGDLSSTADATFAVDVTFNAHFGLTRTRGTETFTGCIDDACGTLESNWHMTFNTDPSTFALIAGRGQARTTGGTGAPTGANGSFTITCEPSAPCTYKGHMRRRPTPAGGRHRARPPQPSPTAAARATPA